MALIFILVALITIQNIFFVPAGELAELNQRTTDAETALVEASSRLDGITARHAFVVDSLKQESDSLNAIAAEAETRARVAARSYRDRSDQLVDSLRRAGEEIISEQIVSLQQSHDSVVVALNDEIDALSADRTLLWRRIEVSDSVIGAQAMQIQASEAVVAALRDERDAWRAKATPSLPKRLAQSWPAVLATLVVVSSVGG